MYVSCPDRPSFLFYHPRCIGWAKLTQDKPTIGSKHKDLQQIIAHLSKTKTSKHAFCGKIQQVQFQNPLFQNPWRRCLNITKDVCKKSPPEILGSVRGRRLFAHVLGNIDILVPWRRLKRSNLSPNHYSYNVWATSQKSVARRIAGRRKRSDRCKN